MLEEGPAKLNSSRLPAAGVAVKAAGWKSQLFCIERPEQDAGPIAQGLNLRGLAQVVQLEHLPRQPLRPW
ncbi:TPA: hypothetical protein ACH3X3_010093 [Trebouxia sp. C0006]